MDNQHKKITGYRDLTQNEIDLMNHAKTFEADAAALLAEVSSAISQAGEISSQQSRDLAMARTHYEDATIRLVRAIANPVSPWFPRT